MGDQINISVLKLSKRSYNALRRGGINTLVQLIEVINNGSLSDIRNIGIGSLDEIIDSLKRLIPDFEIGSDPKECVDYFEQNNLIEHAAIQKNSNSIFQEIVQTAKKMDRIDLGKGNASDEKANLPQEEMPVDLFDVFTKLLPQVFSLTGGERELDLLTKRMGLFGSNTYTLQEIGDFYGISRERVRQLQNKSLQTLKDLTEGSSKKLRLTQNLILGFKKYKALLEQFGPLLLEEDLLQVHRTEIGPIGKHYESDYVKVFMAAFGFERVESKELISGGSTNNCWLTGSTLKKEFVNRIQKVILDILQQTIIPISFFDLVTQINRKNKKVSNPELIKDILRTLESYIEVQNDNYQIKIQYLRSVGDKGFRVLWERNERMEAGEITREINKKMILGFSKTRINSRNLVNQLGGDKRFTSIGKRGWVLSSWSGFDPRPIVDLITESISVKGFPMELQEIIDYVKEIQPDVNEHTIRSYLSHRHRFTRVSKTQFGLAEWKGQPYKSDGTTRNKKTVTIRERVREEVVKFMDSTSHKTASLRELMAHVEKATGCNRRTLYSYISEMSEIVKEKQANNKVYCRLITRTQLNLETVLERIIRMGESDTVEFKSTLRYNIKTQQKDVEIEHSWLKTIAAFLNTGGGQLLVGVNDQSELLGLGLDSFSSNDTLLQYVGSKLAEKIGPQFIPFIKYEINEVRNCQLLVFTVVKSAGPAFLIKTKSEEIFYIRNGNASKALSGIRLVEYVRNNFNN